MLQFARHLQLARVRGREWFRVNDKDVMGFHLCSLRQPKGNELHQHQQLQSHNNTQQRLCWLTRSLIILHAK
jgi:type II secretory pathway component PulL